MQTAMPLTAYTNTFAGNPLDRAGDRRVSADWIAEQRRHPDALALAQWEGRTLVEPAEGKSVRLAYLNGAMAFDAVGGREDRILFLGLWKDAPVFAVEFEGPDPSAGALQGLGHFEEMRPLGLLLPGPEAGIAATAKAVFEWRRRHRFCSACGQESENSDGGWKRICPACKVEHFPRTDPVTIMLPVKGDRCMLGRGAAWPEGRMSALAGFMEPGESIEECCAREMREEAGLIATRVIYHSSQPWPFPSTLMIGLIAEVESEDARPDQTELAEIRWFSRDEIKRMLAEGQYDGVHAAPPLAIAHHLLKAWSEGFGPG